MIYCAFAELTENERIKER